jgi:GTP cyclohydrolase FolE2
MNTEHELFGELHEQEENGLFGNEHRRQYEAQQEALRLSAVIGSVCPCGRRLDEVDIQFKQCYECGRHWGQTDL